MSKSVIIYWSMTGNTQAMAEAIATELGDTEIKVVSEASPSDIQDSSLVILGCPAMGDEVLEEMEFQPFFDGILSDLSGKNVALFGSFGWGDGQWMRDWETAVSDVNATLVASWIARDGDLSELNEFVSKLK